MMDLIENIMIKAFNIWRSIILFMLYVVLAVLALIMAGVETIVLAIKGDVDEVVEDWVWVIKVIKGMFVKDREDEEDAPE